MAEAKAAGQPRNARAMIIATVAAANRCVVATDNENDFDGQQIFNPMLGGAGQGRFERWKRLLLSELRRQVDELDSASALTVARAPAAQHRLVDRPRRVNGPGVSSQGSCMGPSLPLKSALSAQRPGSTQGSSEADNSIFAGGAASQTRGQIVCADRRPRWFGEATGGRPILGS